MTDRRPADADAARHAYASVFGWELALAPGVGSMPAAPSDGERHEVQGDGARSAGRRV
ncbi:hypothetical protein [Conexibacter sp. SYSU D00693]|uniref:hypothetical protein n=1 Tax=Conexibacter sp. SYSU D00693 TaxID=2812560 RepID=UPI00196AA8FC|nr:hypothetical protein [Conexibacter sp. SYSU D00693]